MTLKEIKNNAEFRIRKKGAIWIKLYEQGMNNCMTYAVSKEMSNTRCQRKSLKHRLLKSDKQVFPENK